MSDSLNELNTALDYIYSLGEKGTADKTDLDRLSVLAKSEYSEVRTAVSEVCGNSRIIIYQPWNTGGYYD